MEEVEVFILLFRDGTRNRPFPRRVPPFFFLSLFFSLFLLPRIRIVLFRVNRRRRRRNFDTLKSYFFSFLFFFFRECSECVRFLCYPFRRRRVETIKFLRVRSVFHSGERVDFIIFLEVKWILKRKMRSVYVSEMYKLSEYRFILDFTIKKCYSLSLLPGCYLSSSLPPPPFLFCVFLQCSELMQWKFIDTKHTFFMVNYFKIDLKFIVFNVHNVFIQIWSMN